MSINKTIRSVTTIKLPVDYQGNTVTWLQQLFSLKNDFLGYLLDISNNKDMVRVRFFPFTNTLIIVNPYYISELLDKNKKSLRKSKYNRKISGPLLGKGINLAEDAAHSSQRKFLAKLFSTNRFQSSSKKIFDLTISTMNECRKQSVDLEITMNNLTFDVISDFMIGSKGGNATRRSMYCFSKLIESQLKNAFIPIWFPTFGKIKSKVNIYKIRKDIYNLINNQRENKIHYDGVLSELIFEYGGFDNYNDSLIVDECINLFFAGHETSSKVLLWSILLLDKYPDVMNKVKCEIDIVLNGNIASHQDLKEMKYLSAFVFEVLRLYPPSWVFDRVSIEDIVIDKWLIPKNTHIWISPWCTHHSDNVFKESCVFNPDRWLNGNIKASSSSFIPFGGGHRICLGSNFALFEIKLILIAILQKFTISLKSNKKYIPNPSVTVSIKTPILMTVE